MNDLYQNKGEEVQTSFSFSSDVLAKALQHIYSQKMDVEGEIEPNLFHEICRILDDAAADGVAQSEVEQVNDFLQQLQTNNKVFAAFKVHRMQRDMARLLLDSNGTLKPFEKWVQEVTPIASHQVRHWLQTEYDTAVLRAHQAADCSSSCANAMSCLTSNGCRPHRCIRGLTIDRSGTPYGPSTTRSGASTGRATDGTASATLQPQTRNRRNCRPRTITANRNRGWITIRELLASSFPIPILISQTTVGTVLSINRASRTS